MSIHSSKYYNAKTRILWHIVFWLSYLAAHTLFYGSPDGTYATEFFWALRYLPFKMAATYLTLYIIIPRYLLRKKYVLACLFFLATIAAAVLLQQSVNYAIIIPLINPEWETDYLFYTSKMFKVFLGIYPVVTIAAFIKLVKHWYEKEHQTQALKQQRLEAELKFLKTQIHPHFLFNTLNNLYALTLKKSDDAADVVLMLSELMNYMLYECNEKKVPLQKELEISETYIALEKIRYGKRLDVSFEVTGSARGKEIPPLLLIPFIENSFKHGVSQQPDQTWIAIKVEVQDDKFNLRVKNSLTALTNNTPILNGHQGIGLNNVKRRLELLYSDNHTLDINKTKDYFAIDLHINLNQTVKPEH